MGGSNDIGKQNSQEALHQLCKFIDGIHDVNVIVISAPHRHDLMPSSCVNAEVARFNRLLRKRIKQYKGTMIMDTELNRDCFTNHGLHMNSSGKEQLILKLANMIESPIIKNGGSTIELQWKEMETSLQNNDPVQVMGLGGTPLVTNQAAKDEQMTISNSDTQEIAEDDQMDITNNKVRGPEGNSIGDTEDPRTTGTKGKEPVPEGSEFLWSRHLSPQVLCQKQLALTSRRRTRRKCPIRRKPDFFMDINDSSRQTTKQITPTNNVLKVYHQNIRSLRKNQMN
jgi:hypothetical protein